ncbi:Not1 N-terminal domain, CCR4-Not complex component-domain-containing protein [Tricharina praecox]|uniref:Not1 N-terminal domain, CCR4-Not complex component-domain-containing protein n=1 Tax=Tricharina praecox TaxID=43433 RepID=UPI00221FADF8|nr:Not1 N-terminal domain, CCR4-Not complex component-domain-containing protein [Tricharina praecox]KAI5857973.1 Not1 N-terminal domain, CCR4-Not complex component-domain-containing protein [Tricharina praecox]
MAARKLQQEVERTFKRVAEGIAQFESIYEKLQQCTNSSQKEKLEDSLKREIKKLQRHRDQIKTWAANSEIKDKKPLLDQRKLIETQMEKFKAVEKEMKTKAYSKEGLLASARLDPKSQQKQDMVNFLSDCTTELDRQIEACEAEAEGLAVTLKKGKKGDSSKADRVAEVERIVERHKWHQGKLELIMRLLENGQLEIDNVERIKEDIKWYVESNQDVDFMVDEDENIYDELNLDEEIAEDIFGMGMDADRMSSQDTTSQQDDMSENQAPIKAKEVATARRPSTQIKSPMPIPLTMHTPSPAPSFGVSPSNGSVKPAPLSTRPGELKYASVATAAAAAERNVGIAPLPPPPGQAPVQAAFPPPANPPKQSTPIIQHAQLAQRQNNVPSTPSHVPEKNSPPVSEQSTSPKPNVRLPSPGAPPVGPLPEIPNEPSNSDAAPSPGPSETQVNGTNGTNGTYESTEPSVEQAQDDCVFHLPPGLQDLMESFEATKKRLLPNPPGLTRSLELSYVNAPDSIDAEKPKHYKPTQKYNTPNHYPQEPLPIFDDPALYRRVDTDTLFYVFYYRQGTYQQYLAAKELKRQSWRFHKQYQTWFQRHEEPKTITEEYEQGTYRFFDYESTWMNRRKSDFKFVYKYLEDDL